MIKHSRSPQLLIALATAVALATSAPYLQAQLEQLRGDVFLVQVQGQEPFELRADRMTYTPNGYVALERDGMTVAIFLGYQVTYVMRKTDLGAHAYEVKLQDGSSAVFRADAMRANQQGFVELSTDGQLSGLVRNQVLYVRLQEVEG